MKGGLAVTMLAAIGGLAVVLAAGPVEAGQQRDPGTNGIEVGRQLFATYCASCHGQGGHGDGPVAEALHVRPPDLALVAKRTGNLFVAARIARIVDGRDVMTAHGTMEMPVWGDAFRRREGLSEPSVKARIDAIVQYLASIQERSS